MKDQYIEYALKCESDEDRRIFESIIPGEVLLSANAQKNIKTMVQKIDSIKSDDYFGFLRHIAAVILIACAISAAVSLSIPSVRSAFLNFFESVYENYIGLSYAQDTSDDYPTVLEKTYLPIIPDSWSSDIVLDTPYDYVCEITGNDCENIMFQQCVYSVEKQTIYIDNDPTSTETLYLHHVPATLYTYDDGSMILVWLDNYAFSMVAKEISRDALIALAESVVIQK